MAYNNKKVKERQVVAPSTQRQSIGIVSEVPMNEWDLSISYEKLNIVTYNGGTFIAKRPNLGVEPFSASGWQDVWMPILNGVGISSTVVEYATSDEASSTPPQTGWSSEIPELQGGKFLWVRTTINYTDGKRTVFYSVGTGGVSKTSDLTNDGDGTSPFTTEKQLQEETERATQAESELGNRITQETERAKGVENGLNTRVTSIEGKIPTQASATNKLADQAFVNSSINALAAFYITYNAAGKAFPTRAALLAATTFYQGGKTRVPTQNDYAIVLADESQTKGVDGTYPTTRYSYQGGTYPNGQWDFQYIVNNTSLTQAQVDALNSGITAALVENIKTAVQSGIGSNGITVSKSGTSFTIAGITATNSQIGVAYLAKEVDCGSYTDDKSGTTPKAVKKAIITDTEALDGIFNATSEHRGTMSKDDKAKLDAFGAASTYATKTEVNAKYTKPSGGIPTTDLAAAVQELLKKADSAVQPAALDNYVDLESAQDISGYKRFNGGLFVPSASRISVGSTGGTENSVVYNNSFYVSLSGGSFARYYRNKITYRPVNGASTYTFSFPSADGTLALQENIPTTFPPTGAAGGDLSGTYPNPTIAAGKITKAKLDSDLQDAIDLANSAVQTIPNVSVSSSGSGNAVTAIAQNGHGITVTKGETFAKNADLMALTTRVTTIEGKIPTQASASNQLADKAFVNSTVQTNTANFRGNWTNWAAVPSAVDSYPADYAGGKTPTVNDYLVVQNASDYSAQTLTGTWRFKYSGTWATNGKNGWKPEYQVNETPLTAAQLSALNSGITASLVTQIGTNKTDIASLKTSVAAKYTKPDDGIPALDLAGNIPTSKITGLAKVATSGSYNDLINKPTIPSAYTLPTASTSALGGIKVGAVRTTTVSATTGGTATDKCYALEVDSAGKGFVRVPWTDNNTTYKQATTSTLGLIKIAATARTTAITTTQGGTTSNRYYGVELDSTGKAFVNVPWENTHQSLANYYNKTQTDAAISTAIDNAITKVLNTPV